MQLLKSGSLKGQKILIVMLWTHELNREKENKKIMPGYLFESGIKNQTVDYFHPSRNEYCVETAVKRLGGEIYVVTNYKDANYELLKKEKGRCPYYSVWIMSGWNKSILPDKDADPNLLDEFMNIIHLYSSQGGSLVLFGESDPLFFQANLYLENHHFPTEFGLVKTSLRLQGNHEGKKILNAEENGNLFKNSTFNAKEEICYPNSNNSSDPAIKRPNLGNNLLKIYEGETISYASYDIYPFDIFAIDSEGGATILIYMGRNGHGDVIVDGGFTKCFLSMTEEGTFRYLQNLAAFTSRIECHFNKVVRPKNINYCVQNVVEPISTYYRKIIIIDSQINLFNISAISQIVKKEFIEGDLIYMSNNRNYKVTLEDLKTMKFFYPDFSFNNDVIIKEINSFKKDLYNEIYILDVGEQQTNESKFGDLLLVHHKLINYYNMLHLSILYSHNDLPFRRIKNILNSSENIFSSNNDYRQIRNYIYGANINIEKDELKEIKSILSKKYFLLMDNLKYRILN